MSDSCPHGRDWLSYCAACERAGQSSVPAHRASGEGGSPSALRASAPEGIDARLMAADAMEGELRRQIADLQQTVKAWKAKEADTYARYCKLTHDAVALMEDRDSLRAASGGGGPSSAASAASAPEGISADPLPLDGLPEAIAAAKSALKRNGFDDPLPHVAWRFAICAAMKAVQSSAAAPLTPEGRPSGTQATSDEEIALEMATWLRGVVRDTPGAVDRELALARAVWLEEIANRARAYTPPAANWIRIYRETAEVAADHLDAEADSLRDSHTIGGAWPLVADETTREAKADHDSMRSCAAALRAKP